MHMRGLIPRNFAELAEAVPIGNKYFRFKKRWRVTITNYHSEISKNRNAKFRPFLHEKQPRDTRVAENMTV